MRGMLSFGTEHIQWLLKILLLGREKLLFMGENQGLNSWVTHAMKTWEVYRGILATSLMFRAGIFRGCDDRSRGSNRVYWICKPAWGIHAVLVDRSGRRWKVPLLYWVYLADFLPLHLSPTHFTLSLDLVLISHFSQSWVSCICSFFPY